MTADVLDISNVLQSVLSLPRPERSYLVNKLIVSLDDDDDTEISQEWRDELNRRVESMRNGTSPGIPHEEVMSNMRTLLADIRKEKQSR